MQLQSDIRIKFLLGRILECETNGIMVANASLPHVGHRKPIKNELVCSMPSFATMRHFCWTNTHPPRIPAPLGTFPLPESLQRQNGTLHKTRCHLSLDTYRSLRVSKFTRGVIIEYKQHMTRITID